jgi:hypothetical protein
MYFSLYIVKKHKIDHSSATSEKISTDVERLGFCLLGHDGTDVGGTDLCANINC